MVLYAPARHFGAHVCLTVDGGDGWTFSAAPHDRILVRFAGTGHRTVHLAACPGDHAP